MPPLLPLADPIPCPDSFLTLFVVPAEPRVPVARQATHAHAHASHTKDTLGNGVTCRNFNRLMAARPSWTRSSVHGNYREAGVGPGQKGTALDEDDRPPAPPTRDLLPGGGRGVGCH